MNRMLQFVTVAILLAFAAMSVAAQNEKNKFEFYGGYSFLRTDLGNVSASTEGTSTGLDSHINSHGFNASITGNVHRYVGVKFDFSTHSKSESFTSGGVTGSGKIGRASCRERV